MTEIHSYTPLPKQQEFHNPNYRNKFFIGGFGSGKTKALVWEAIDLSLRYPENFILLTRKYNEDIKHTILKMFFEECPAEIIKGIYDGGHTIEFKNGSRIIFSGLYTKQKTRITKVGSLNLGAFGIDEGQEAAEEDYMMLQGRLRLQRVPKHYGLVVSNPPNINHWIYKKAVLNKPDDTLLVQSSSYDNPHLPTEYLENLLREYPETWVKRFIYGQFGFITPGYSVYQGVLEDKHITELKFNSAKPILRGWDFGWHRPAVVFCQIDPDDRFLILKEYIGEKIYLNDFVSKIIEFSNRRFPDVTFEDFCDPAGTQKSDKSVQTSIDILRSKGIYPRFRKVEESLIRNIIQQKINTYIGDRPSLLIDTSCRLVKEAFLGGYYFAKDDEGIPENKPYKDGLYEHCISGNTKIRTLNGWYRIKDLIGQEIITYAYDHKSKRLVPAKANQIRKTREKAEVWKLTFNNGELFATPDHLVMLRNGSYLPLSQLKEGYELMPFYEAKRSLEDHYAIHLNDGSIVDEHRYIFNWFKGHLREGYHIHHLDENPVNNYPENLIQILSEEHMQKVYQNNRKHYTADLMKKGSLNPWTQESRNKISLWAKAYWSGKGYVGVGHSKYCSKFCSEKAKRLKEKQEMELQKINHKVIEVKFYGYEDVYNMEVPEYHNFVANGILVHNCMDAIRYIFACLYTNLQQKHFEDFKIQEPKWFGVCAYG